MAGAYKLAHKNAANSPKIFGGQFAAFLCMIVYMRIIPTLSGASFNDFLFSRENGQPCSSVTIYHHL